MKVLGYTVLVKNIEKNVTEAGIILPDDNEPKLRFGEVKYIGDKVEYLDVGDKVFFPHYIKKILDYEGEVYHVMTEGDCVGVIKESED